MVRDAAFDVPGRIGALRLLPIGLQLADPAGGLAGAVNLGAEILFAGRVALAAATAAIDELDQVRVVVSIATIAAGPLAAFGVAGGDAELGRIEALVLERPMRIKAMSARSPARVAARAAGVGRGSRPWRCNQREIDAWPPIFRTIAINFSANSVAVTSDALPLIGS